MKARAALPPTVANPDIGRRTESLNKPSTTNILLVTANSGHRRTPPAGRNMDGFAMGLALGGEVHACGVDEVLINQPTGVMSMFRLADFGGNRQARLAFGVAVG